VAGLGAARVPRYIFLRNGPDWKQAERRITWGGSDRNGTQTTAPQTTTAAPSRSAAFPALGAEKSLGSTCATPIDEGRFKQRFLETWNQHLVILLRDQTADEDAQVRFAEMFGPPAPVNLGAQFSASASRRDADLEHPRGWQADRRAARRRDALPHRPVPPAGSRQAKVALCDRDPEGGRQQFVLECLRAYETLPRGDQAALGGPARVQRL